MATEVKAPARAGASKAVKRNYPDLREHIAALDKAGRLQVIDQPVNKDTQLHPLVRWQYRGGIDEKDRKAFLFNKPTDHSGKIYDIPVVVGVMAGNHEIYRIGMQCAPEQVPAKWVHAMNNPIEPRLIDQGVCQEIVIEGAELDEEGQGLDALPVPISTPGFDNAPYTAAGHLITKDPDTGTQNAGVYRGQIKARRRIGANPASTSGATQHWLKYKERGEPMPAALVIGGPPCVSYSAVQKVPAHLDELWVAGGLVDEPINVVKGRTVDLLIPAEAEIVIEGFIPTDMFEPEGPFGESHGYVNLQHYKEYMDVTAITRRKNAILMSFISQLAPSESSMIKKAPYETNYLDHLTTHLGIKGVKNVGMHEPLTGILAVVVIQCEKGMPETEVWRALYGAAAFGRIEGKWILAVNEDIDPNNAHALFWAMSYRCQAQHDLRVLPKKERGHEPPGPKDGGEVASVLINATLKKDYPPVSLPKKEFMEDAKRLWEELGLPPLKPESPWYGYTLGDWPDELVRQADLAAKGEYWETGKLNAQLRRSEVLMGARVSAVKEVDDD